MARQEPMPKQEASRARERGKTARDKQLQRAQDRQKKFGPQKTVTPSNVQNITLLESMTVSSTRRETYVQAWDTFTQFVKTSRLKIVTVEQLDGAAVWWIDHLYFQGENVACSHDLHGGSEVLQKRCVPHVRLEPGDEGFQRFQEDCPGSGPSSSGLSDASSDSAAHPDPQAQAGCVSLAAPHLASVRTPGGSVQAPMETHGGSKPHQPFLVSSHVPVIGRGGGGHALQGGRNRRECDFECQLPSMDEPTAGALEDCSQRQRLCVSISAESRKQNLLGGCRRTWVSKQWRAMHIPDQTWGRINRSPLPWQSTGRCDEEGPLENTSVREALRTGRQTRSGLRVVVQKQCLDSEALLAQQMLTFVGCRKRPKVVFSWKSSPAREI